MNSRKGFVPIIGLALLLALAVGLGLFVWRANDLRNVFTKPKAADISVLRIGKSIVITPTASKPVTKFKYTFYNRDNGQQLTAPCLTERTVNKATASNTDSLKITYAEMNCAGKNIEVRMTYTDAQGLISSSGTNCVASFDVERPVAIVPTDGHYQVKNPAGSPVDIAEEFDVIGNGTTVKNFKSHLASSVTGCKYTIENPSNVAIVNGKFSFDYNHLVVEGTVKSVGSIDLIVKTVGPYSNSCGSFNNSVYGPWYETATLQQAAPQIPNCTNLTGPTTLTVGQAGTYSANFSSPQGNLGGEIFAGQNGTGIWFPGNKGISGNSGSLSFAWTPTAAGTYDVLCRAWNDGIAECRGKSNYVDGPPRYACAGPTSSMTVTVTQQAAQQYRLSINILLQNFAAGTVTSDYGGINCNSSSANGVQGVCYAQFDPGAHVILTATAGTGSVFNVWDEGCTIINGKCSLVMDTTKTISAGFKQNTTALQPAASADTSDIFQYNQYVSQHD